MSRHNQHRRDLNHGEIVKALEATGHSVLDLSQQGGGCPDLLVARSGVNVLMEVKSEGGETSPGQDKFRANWKGPCICVWSAEEAIAKMNEEVTG